MFYPAYAVTTVFIQQNFVPSSNAKIQVTIIVKVTAGNVNRMSKVGNSNNPPTLSSIKVFKNFQVSINAADYIRNTISRNIGNVYRSCSTISKVII